MDIVGGVRIVDGSEAKTVSGIDDHARFVVSAKVVARATARPVCDALTSAMDTLGLPEEILTDNGKVFDRLETESLGHRRDEQQPGIRDQVRVINDRVDPVERVRYSRH